MIKFSNMNVCVSNVRIMLWKHWYKQVHMYCKQIHFILNAPKGLYFNFAQYLSMFIIDVFFAILDH